jgi:hypothetical protein
MAYSTCCGAHTNFTELGICPDCLEHCDWENEEDIEEEDEMKQIKLNKQLKQTTMAKYELVKKTQLDGEVWYHITKDGDHVNETYTRFLDEANELFDKITNGKTIEPIIEIIKTIQIDEN